MTRARDVSRLITTPPSIYQTDAETSTSAYLTQASASSTYLTQSNYNYFKNIINNGDMRIAQRGTTFSFGSGGGARYYSVDRFQTENYNWSAGSNITVSQETSIVPSGFSYAAKWANGGTGLTFGSGGVQMIRTAIEGYDIARYYSNILTLSFWVRSSTAGIYNLFLENGNWGAGTTTRAIQLEYTINNSNTWEQKSFQINMATATSSGTWQTTNGFGMAISWVLGAHSDRTGSSYLNTWSTHSSNHFKTTNATNLATIANQSFYLTGVQLELGSNMTSFDYRPYELELRKCQRYYEKVFVTWGGNITNGGRYLGGSTWKVEKRDNPSLIGSYYSSNYGFPNTALDPSNSTIYGFNYYDDATASVTGGYYFGYVAGEIDF